MDDHLDSSASENHPALSNEKKNLVKIKKKKNKATTHALPLPIDDDNAPPPQQPILALNAAPQADHALVSVTPTKKRPASTNSTPDMKNKKMHNSADRHLVHNVNDVTPTKNHSTSTTNSNSAPTKKTLADCKPVTQPPCTTILSSYTTTFEKDGNQHNAFQESSQLGAQETENAAHYSPVNTHGDKTSDIDELTASNNVLAHEIGISSNTTQPLNSISQNSVEPMENGSTPHAAAAAAGTEVDHASNIEPNVTNDSDDFLDVMVANAFDSDPPLHDMDEDSDHVDINGFKVSQEFKDIAREILDKRGDIFAKASVSGLLRRLLFNIVCAISDKLARFTVPELSLGQLKSMCQNVEELLKFDVDVTWLAKSLKELIEMKEMPPQLRHLLLVRKQKKKIAVQLEKERELQLKIAQKAKQKAEDIDIRVKTVTEEIDSIYHTVMTKVTKMQQCKDKPAKDVASFYYV